MALLTSIEEVREWIPVAFANSISRVQESETAEENWLLPVLGNELYQELVTAYEGDSLSNDQRQLLRKCQAVIVPMAYVDSLPFIQTLITDNGVVAMETAETRKAFKWEYNNVVEALQKRGYNALELLILFLKKNADNFPKWSESPYNDKNGFAIIRSGADLGSVTTLLQPHRSYMLLRGLFPLVAELYLVENLGLEYYAALTQRIIDGAVEGAEIRALQLITMATVRLSLYMAASGEFSVLFDANGFTLINGNIKDNTAEGKVSASDQRLEKFKTEMSTTGMLFLNKAVDHMNATASVTVMPEFFNSPYYTAPQSETGNNTCSSLDNSNYKGFFTF